MNPARGAGSRPQRKRGGGSRRQDLRADRHAAHSDAGRSEASASRPRRARDGQRIEEDRLRRGRREPGSKYDKARELGIAVLDEEQDLLKIARHNTSRQVLMNKITKAVFPVAGMGTRFLPATKASPKEMMPVVDKPLIQYAVEEAVAAGMTEMIFITGRGKRAIEDHFDKASELESRARAARQASDLLQIVQEHHAEATSPASTCASRRRSGSGHAVLCALPVVGDEPFAVVLADDLIDAQDAGARSRWRRSTRGAGARWSRCRTSRATRRGATASCASKDARSRRIASAASWRSPSPTRRRRRWAWSAATSSRRASSITCSTQKPGAGGEIQLTDAIAALLAEEDVFAYEFEGVRYDCGSKLGYLKANLAFAVKHPEIGAEFRSYLRIAGLRARKYAARRWDSAQHH